MEVGYATNFYTKIDSVQSLNWQPGFSGRSNGWIYSREYKSGLYFVALTNENGSIIRKISIEK